MTNTLHFNEARRNVLEAVESLAKQRRIQRLLFTPDIFARIRVVMWTKDALSDNERREIESTLSEHAGPFWGGILFLASSELDDVNRNAAETLWEESAIYKNNTKIRISERHRSLTVWLHPLFEPPWAVDRGGRTPEHPPIVSFYAFKGGTGRSTALAIFAAQRAQEGERVAVVDLDLAAPGAGRLLLKADEIPAYGVVDYWLERPQIGSKLVLGDYYGRVTSSAVVGKGEIFVFPAGRFDEDYLLKLSRLDFLPPKYGKHPHVLLLDQIREELKPNWILLDARAGLSEEAGFVLGNVAHLNLLFSGTTEASWDGLRLAIRRLGADRIARGLPQAECLLVHSIAPANPQLAALADETFMRKATAAFEEMYYCAKGSRDDEDRFWTLDDMEDRDAPHRPVTLKYSEAIAFYADVESVIKYGVNDASDYRALGARIAERFPAKVEYAAG